MHRNKFAAASSIAKRRRTVKPGGRAGCIPVPAPHAGRWKYQPEAPARAAPAGKSQKFNADRGTPSLALRAGIGADTGMQCGPDRTLLRSRRTVIMARRWEQGFSCGTCGGSGLCEGRRKAVLPWSNYWSSSPSSACSSPCSCPRSKAFASRPAGQPVRTTSISWPSAVSSMNRPRGSCPPAAGATVGPAIRTAGSRRLSRADGVTTFSLTSTRSRCTTWGKSAATATTSPPRSPPQTSRGRRCRRRDGPSPC